MTTEQALREALEKIVRLAWPAASDIARAALALPPTPVRTEWRVRGLYNMAIHPCKSLAECEFLAAGFKHAYRIESRIVPEPGPWVEVKE